VATTNIEPTISNEWYTVKRTTNSVDLWEVVREKDKVDRHFEEVPLDRIYRDPRCFGNDLKLAANIVALDCALELDFVS
jgi:hypothetical protein